MSRRSPTRDPDVVVRPRRRWPGRPGTKHQARDSDANDSSRAERPLARGRPGQGLGEPRRARGGADHRRLTTRSGVKAEQDHDIEGPVVVEPRAAAYAQQLSRSDTDAWGQRRTDAAGSAPASTDRTRGRLRYANCAGGKGGGSSSRLARRSSSPEEATTGNTRSVSETYPDRSREGVSSRHGREGLSVQRGERAATRWRRRRPGSITSAGSGHSLGVLAMAGGHRPDRRLGGRGGDTATAAIRRRSERCRDT